MPNGRAPLKYRNAHSGTYHVANREKYVGLHDPQYKSLLECKMMYYLDHNPNIVRWNYEPMPIKYIDESTNERKVRNYYIDFTAIVKNRTSYHTVWIEVKSESEMRPPSNRVKDKASAMKIWMKNQSKWKAARELAEAKGIKFVIISEKELNNG